MLPYKEAQQVGWHPLMITSCQVLMGPHIITTTRVVCCEVQAYIEEFLRQREDKKAAALAAARAEDEKIKQYWSMVR
jgi:hypothetical protein